jgi:hypothetical protein
MTSREMLAQGAKLFTTCIAGKKTVLIEHWLLPNRVQQRTAKAAQALHLAD